MAFPTVSFSPSLQLAAARFAGEHFIDETLVLLQAIVDKDLDGLIGAGDEDFAVIDVDPTARTASARSQPEWEPWFRRYFLMLDALDASTGCEIEAYRALKTSELGYSVVEFRHTIQSRTLAAWFDCVATIVWKNTEDGWKEARWHCSILDRGLEGTEQLDMNGGRIDARTMAAG